MDSLEISVLDLAKDVRPRLPARPVKKEMNGLGFLCRIAPPSTPRSFVHVLVQRRKVKW